LLQQWRGLSDHALEAAVDDRLWLRRFCGIPPDWSAADHASIWRCRQKWPRKVLITRHWVQKYVDKTGSVTPTPETEIMFLGRKG
jgi:hypothetical protein